MATISVKLARSWFAPNGSRYDVAGNPHNFPASWKENLPSSAKVIETEEGEEVEELPLETGKKK